MFPYRSEMRTDLQYYVYMLASKRNGTLYVGVTRDLVKRIWQHKTEQADGFTKQYNVKTLVWFEPHMQIEMAIHREKRLKWWRRSWKLALIEDSNPHWNDLYPQITA